MEDTTVNTREVAGMFEGPVLPLTIKLSIPFFISNIVGLFYLVIDTYFITLIDRSSTAIISGTGLVFPVFFLFISLAGGLSIGVSSLVARAIGEKNQAALDRAVDSGLLISIIIAIATLVLGYVFGGDIIRALAGSGLTEEAVGIGLTFFRSLLPALGLMLVGNTLMGVLQGEGLTKYIAIASVLAAVVNIALDPVFIFVCKMGVAGAGLATTIGISCTAVYVIIIFKTNKSSVPIHWNPFKAKASIMAEIIRVGSVQTLQLTALSVTFMFLNNIVSSIGQDAMNSWSLCCRTDQVILIPATAVSGATISMAGQNYGRGNLERLRQIYLRNIIFGLILVAIVAVLYNMVARMIFAEFSTVEKVINGSVEQVRALSFTFLGVTVAMITGSTFQATGKPLPVLVITLFRMIIISVPVAYLLVYRFGMGMTGVFIGFGMGNVLALPISWTWARGHLRNLKVRTLG
jgi:putative MATE family efflux protein